MVARVYSGVYFQLTSKLTTILGINKLNKIAASFLRKIKVFKPKSIINCRLIIEVQ